MRVNYLGPGAASQASERKREIRRLAARTPLGDSSITRPNKQLRVGPEGTGGTLNSDGTMDWAGIVRFIGEFFQTGPSVFEGSVSVTGADGSLDVAADAHFGGDTTIGKNLEVTAETRLNGLVTLLKQLKVATGGEISVEDGRIRVLGGSVDMTIENGAIDFDNGGHISGDGDTVVISAGGGPKFVVTPSNLTMLASLSNFINVSNSGNEIHGNTEFSDDVSLALGARLYGPGLTPLPSGATGVPLIMDAATFRLHLG